MLFQELGKMKRTSIMTSLIMITIGLVMILCPVEYMGMLVSALGYILLVMASVMVLDYLSSKKVLVNYISLAGGLLVGLLGLFVMVKRRDVLPMLGLVFGLFLVVTGISDLSRAFRYTRRAGSTVWGLMAVFGVVTIVFGLLLLFNPCWNTPASLKQVIGGMLLITSVFSIIRVVLTWPFKNV